MTISTLLSPPAAAVVRQLRASLRGTVVAAADAPYDAARQIWNGAVSHRPALIARCVGDEDITAAIRAAREHGLTLSVRGGGHDWAGRALRDGGLVLDLSAMRHVTVDPDARTAVAQGGATAGDVAAAAATCGLAPVTGTVKAVGMAGLTLAGGYGPLCGRHGLALDNLLDADVVLADGRRVAASDAGDADLYWALRGGGGTFGVVTAARYRLHPLPQVLAGLILFPLDQAGAVLRGYAEIAAAAPDELTVMTGFLNVGGQMLLFLFPAWSGDPARGEDAIAALQRLGTPVMTQVAPMPYAGVLGMFDASVVNGRHHALATRWLPALTDDTAAMLTAAASGANSPFSVIAVHHFHGAAARVPAQDTAFALRRDHLLVEILAAWEPSPHDDGTAHRAWAQDLSGQLAPSALPGGYPNLLGPGDSDRTMLAYGANAPRLRDLKHQYDPDGVFSTATGTLPAAAP
jgi:FAD/FMN-containing dehydrogenase